MPRSRSLADALVGLVLALASFAALAESVGSVTHLEGVLAVQRGGSSKLLSVGSEVEEGDILSTQPAAYARIQFIDKGEVALRPNTVFQVKQYRYEEAGLTSGNIIFNLIKGGLRSVTGLVAKRRKENFRLETANATIGIRGTYFGVLYCKNDCDDVKDNSGRTPRNGLHADVTKGAISLTNNAAELVVHEGEYAYVESIDTAPTLVAKEDAVVVRLPDSILNDGATGGLGPANEEMCKVE